jgi:hypothetical protein
MSDSLQSDFRSDRRCRELELPDILHFTSVDSSYRSCAVHQYHAAERESGTENSNVGWRFAEKQPRQDEGRDGFEVREARQFVR